MLGELRRWSAAALLSALLVASGLTPLGVCAAGATSSDGRSAAPTQIRYAGADRYATSLQVAEAVAADAGGQLEWVVMVSGERWTDAVVAAPLAGRLNTAVLMTPPAELRADAQEFLSRLGVSKVLMVGPRSSGSGHGPGRPVRGAVVDALKALGMSVERIGGDDVYDTAATVARRVGMPGQFGGLGATAVLASGEVFADALVAGPFAARGGHPVLLTRPGELSAATATYLEASNVAAVIVMGGGAAISQAVRDAVADLGIRIEPVSGETRFDTAAQAAALTEGRYTNAAQQPCFSSSTVGMARARVPFDSFSAAPLLARLCAPLLLAEPTQVPAHTTTYLDDARAHHSGVDLRVFGGEAAVGQSAISTALGVEDADTATSASVLPPGACGGDASDAPQRLINDPMSQDPAWSPDCTQVVYAKRRELWVADADGSNRRRILAGSRWKERPTWSPDGQRLLFVEHSNVGDIWKSHVWVVDANGDGRTKLTSGDVWDDSPSWSPDGKRIAFDRLSGDGRDENHERINAQRYIVVMNSDGSGLKELTPGGDADLTPVYSPDGRSIAYVGGNTVRVMSSDGTADRAIAGGAWWRGGVTWSPDGTRIAYATGSDAAGGDIVAVDLHGTEERQITELPGWAAKPKWSPDGQRIAFTHYDQAKDALQPYEARYVSVTGALGTPLSSGASTCRPPSGNPERVTAGFPLPDWAVPAEGKLRVAVLFVDFPDAAASHSTQVEANRGLPWSEKYLEAMSYGQLDVEYVPLHRWLRMPESYRDYMEVNVLGKDQIAGAIYDDAVKLADNDFDFSGFDSLAIIGPSNRFVSGHAAGAVMADGAELRAHMLHDRLPESEHLPDDWGWIESHELIHNLGLLDLYPFDSTLHERPTSAHGREWVSVKLGLMLLSAYYSDATSSQERAHTWRHPSGHTDVKYTTDIHLLEMLAWHRGQLGWLDESQILCVTGPASSVQLAPVAEPQGGMAMAAIPLNRHEILVIESRRKLGYDEGRRFTNQHGWTTTYPGLLAEGLLVYTVDSFVGGGQVPAKVAGDNGNGRVDGFPIVEVGESVTVRGHTVTLAADNGRTHTVTIVRNSN